MATAKKKAAGKKSAAKKGGAAKKICYSSEIQKLFSSKQVGEEKKKSRYCSTFVCLC
jgi:hypothetical protein